jgi:uncharacterized membrane protein (UPF0127 family)
VTRARLRIAHVRAALAVVLCVLAACSPSRAAGTVELVSSSGAVVPVAVELATTPEARQLGLMYRDQLAPGTGMLFIFPHAAEQSFWMRNTKIPLDIVYIDDAGKIVRLYARTTPYSEKSLPSGSAVRFVLEVPGGFCAEHGIREGDTVRLGALATHPAR